MVTAVVIDLDLPMALSKVAAHSSFNGKIHDFFQDSFDWVCLPIENETLPPSRVTIPFKNMKILKKKIFLKGQLWNLLLISLCSSFNKEL